MFFFLLVLDTFLNLRVVGYLAEEFPYIEGLFETLVFEVVIEYAGELDGIDHYQHDTGKERNMELLSECPSDHPGQCDPAYIIHQFVDGSSPLSGRSDHLASLAGSQDTEPGIDDYQYQSQQKERQQPFIEAYERGEEGSRGTPDYISVLHGSASGSSTSS